AIEYRWAEGHFDRLPALAAELANRPVTVIAALGSSAPGLAAKAATSTIPIVFQTGGDPVQDGLVASLNRPGGHLTGVSRLAVTMIPKRLELLREVFPRATAVALLVNPTNQIFETQIQEVREAAHVLGLGLQVVRASTTSELDQVFGQLAERQGTPLL